MTVAFEDLEILKTAEGIADQIWKEVTRWDSFARDVVGKQMAEAGDSIGANIAEGYGRFHYGEKLQFFYYSRGSLFETKYWLNRALTRGLTEKLKFEQLVNQLTDLARRLNKLATSTKQQKFSTAKGVREMQADYLMYEFPEELFTQEELVWLETLPNS